MRCLRVDAWSGWAWLVAGDALSCSAERTLRCLSFEPENFTLHHSVLLFQFVQLSVLRLVQSVLSVVAFGSLCLSSTLAHTTDSIIPPNIRSSILQLLAHPYRL